MYEDYLNYSKEELIELLCDCGIAPKCRSSSDLWQCLKKYGKREQEHFGVVVLNSSNMILKVQVVSIGLVNRTLVHPREVFRPTLSSNGSAVVVFHNHPSGNLMPSGEDLEVTDRLKEAGELLGIQLMDHLILGRGGYRSMREEQDFCFV
jgi:DNA repair protein RadC